MDFPSLFAKDFHSVPFTVVIAGRFPCMACIYTGGIPDYSMSVCSMRATERNFLPPGFLSFSASSGCCRSLKSILAGVEPRACFLWTSPGVQMRDSEIYKFDRRNLVQD